ncbi:MAG: cell division protein ZapA [Methylophilaceae bacterium]
MSESNAVDVNILGREFTVSCTEEERASLLEAVSYLDKKMRDIRDTGKIIGVERIAIMAALNISHELLNTKNGNVNVGDIRRRVVKMLDQIDQAHTTKEPSN